MDKLFNKDVIIYIIILAIVIIMGTIKVIIPSIQDISEKNNRIATLNTQLTKLERQKGKTQSQLSSIQNMPKQQYPVSIYTSPYPDMDVENASVDLVDELISMIRDTDNRITEISFNNGSAPSPNQPATPAPNPMQQPTPSNQGGPSILNISMTLNGSYVSLQNLLQKIYIWKYLAGINDISVTPENGNTEILSSKLNISLYINK